MCSRRVDFRLDLSYTVFKFITYIGEDSPISLEIGTTMIPAGYMYKRIVLPEWLDCKNVAKMYSVSGCFSENFADYIPYWKHNQYWFFDNPEVMDGIIHEQKFVNDFELLYYELYEQEFDEEEQHWQEFSGETSFGYDVKSPSQKEFLGFDIVSFSMGTSPECSPLSCNHLCRVVNVNQYCLLDDLNDTISLTETLNYTKCEPGPYRIIAVYKIGKAA